MDAPDEIGPAQARRGLLPRFWQSASSFWSGRWAYVAWGLTLFLVLIVLLQLLVQFLLNLWNRQFFDALERRDAAALWTQGGIFIVLAAASIALAAISVWGRMTAQRKWRECLTRQVLEYWLAEDHFRRLDYPGSGSANPEYRLSEDVRVATDAPVDLLLAFLASVLTAIIFLTVLWSVGGDLTFEVAGQSWTIPGYLVIGVVVYSSFFSSAMVMAGRDLTEVIERKNQAEAEFRAAADRLRQVNNVTGSHEGKGERRALWMAVHVVLKRWLSLCWALVQTTLVSHGNSILAPVLGWFLCVPKYLAGTMTLGELTQAAAAFVTVQSAFNWLVDNFGRIADWRSSAHRVAALLLALDQLDQADRLAGSDSTAPDTAAAAEGAQSPDEA